MKGKGILALCKRYSVVIIFPTFTVSTIYADWSHTRKWKQSQIEKQKASEFQ